MALPWVVELKKILNDNEMGINQKAAKALAGSQQAGLAYATVLKPKEVSRSILRIEEGRCATTLM